MSVQPIEDLIMVDEPENLQIGGNAAAQLRSIVERAENLESERKDLATDIKEIYSEAKGNGFDPKIIRKVIAMRRIGKAALDEERTYIDLYLAALGMLPT